MKKATLLNNVKELGYPLFETEKSLNASETLAEVVKSNDIRLWEGFPLMLANCLERDLFNYKSVQIRLKNAKHKKYFRSLVVLSLALYKYLELKFSFTDKLYNSNYFNRNLFDKILKYFKEKNDLSINSKTLSTERLINTFINYYKSSEFNIKDYSKMKDEFDFEYALSQVFSQKQKELFVKKVRGEKMTKTEREYFSRSIRKKLFALANSDLHKLAAKLTKK